MRKWITFFSAFALLIVISFSSYIYFYRAEFLATSLSRLYGVPVKVSKVRLSKSGVKLFNVVVYNPSDYVLQPALSIACVDVKIKPTELVSLLLTSQPATLRKITLIDPLVGIEMKNPTGTENNWINILTHMAKEVDQPAKRKIQVPKIDLQDLVIELRNHSARKNAKRPPPIGHIEIVPNKKGSPITLSELTYWVTKLTLVQIGERLGQSDFTNAIKSCPQPQTRPQTLQIS